MKTEYNSVLNKHLSRDEIIRLAKNNLANRDRENALRHLAECKFCSEAVEGLKQLPDLSALHTMSAQWKVKTGVQPTSKTLQINLHTFYILLTLIGLISIAIVYFFFFNPDKRKTITKPENVIAKPTILQNKNEHFVVEQVPNLVDSESTTTPKNIVPKIAEGTYDNPKKEITSIEKIEPIASQKAISQQRLNVIKGISKQKLLNIEGFKIIDYSADYVQNDNILNSFSQGLEARYESEKHFNEIEKGADKLTSTVTYEDVIAKALHSYKNKKYDAAISDFNFIMNYFPDDLNCKFYKALCYQDASLYINAIDQFKVLSENNTHTFYEEAKWHLALCYNLVGDKSESKNLLKEIINENGFYKEQAFELLNKK